MRVDMRVIDVSGRLVTTLVKGPFVPGRSVVWWDGRTHSGARAVPGVYFCILTADKAVRTVKFVRVR
jgi:hypothetical protein